MTKISAEITTKLTRSTENPKDLDKNLKRVSENREMQDTTKTNTAPTKTKEE